MKNLENWKRDLDRIDTPKNHRKLTNRLLKDFLSSPFADDQSYRLDVMLFLAHIKKLLK